MSKAAVFFIPSQSTVAGLAIGDKALTWFGQFQPVTQVVHRGKDSKGRAFVGYYADGRGGLYKAEKLVWTADLLAAFTVEELDRIEAETAGRGLYLDRADCRLTRTAGGGWLLTTEAEA